MTFKLTVSDVHLPISSASTIGGAESSTSVNEHTYSNNDCVGEHWNST